jgi:hypothetical protein
MTVLEHGSALDTVAAMSVADDVRPPSALPDASIAGFGG